MKKEVINHWVRLDYLRKRMIDRQKVNSMVASARDNMGIVKTIPITEKSAILIFRETYESIRQLGDASWLLQGYEPRNHEVCMEVLKDFDIKNKVMLQHLNRFKKIRNDINYRGFKATLAQATEILKLWDACSEEIISLLTKKP